MANAPNRKSDNTDEWAQWIKDEIAKAYIKYYDYSEFQNIVCIGTGGFGEVYRATWEGSDTVVALKSLKNNGLMKEIVNEVYQIICIISIKQIKVIYIYTY
jgi:serine/threonine protein kinase